nr:LCP family protein [Lacticaseibacillus manihotivorans]
MRTIKADQHARATVEKLLNVPIDYYVTIDMGGLETVVDALGGIDVDVPFTFTSSHTDNLHFTKGPMHLNGKYALAYAGCGTKILSKITVGKSANNK